MNRNAHSPSSRGTASGAVVQPKPETDRADADDTTTAVADAADALTATVLTTPRGDFFHLPLGESNVCACGARAGSPETIERHTLYRAKEEMELEPCTRCTFPWRSD